MNELFSKSELKNYLFILMGSIVLGLGVVGFFIPNSILTGGTAGLSLLLHYLTSYSVGTIMIVVNLPLLVIGGKYLGKMFAIRTVMTILLISFSIDFFAQIVHLPAFIFDTILQ